MVLPQDFNPETQGQLADLGCKRFASIEQLLAAQPQLAIDLAVVPTPIHLHAPMAEALLRAGMHVLLEKPLTGSLAEARRLAQTALDCDRKLTIGFQYLHAPEVRALRKHLQGGAIGTLQRATIIGAWPRPHAYYQRNTWAGRCKSQDKWVLDSPVNNAMSHFVMLMLHLCDCESLEGWQLGGELYRAQDIEMYDTAIFSFTHPNRPRMDFYGTHSAKDLIRPSLRLEGSEGVAEWQQDRFAKLSNADGEWHQEANPESVTREVMLRDIIAHWRGEDAFVCGPHLAMTHVECVWALHASIPTTPISAAFTVQKEEENGPRTYVPGLGEALQTAAHQGVGLHQVGAPWATLPTQSTVSHPEV